MMEEEIVKILTMHYGAIHVGNDEYKIKCPFHRDNHPSCGVNVRRGIFNCFSCNEKGSLRRLIPSIPVNYEWGDDNVHNEEKDFGVSFDVLRIIHDTYSDNFKTYIQSRGIDIAIVKKLGCIDNTKMSALVAPMNDGNNNIGIVCRRYNDRSPKVLSFGNISDGFGFYNGYKHVVIVEGIFDALSFYMIGIPAIFVSGFSISINRLKILRQCNSVTLCFDGDDAGISLTNEWSKALIGNCKIIQLKPSEDPNNVSYVYLADKYNEAVK